MSNRLFLALAAATATALLLTACASVTPVGQIGQPPNTKVSAPAPEKKERLTPYLEAYLRDLMAAREREGVSSTLTVARSVTLLRKELRFKAYGENPALVCAREATVLTSHGYSTEVSDQDRESPSCQYRFRHQGGIVGLVTVSRTDQDEWLEMRAEIKVSKSR